MVFQQFALRQLVSDSVLPVCATGNHVIDTQHSEHLGVYSKPFHLESSPNNNVYYTE